MLGAALPAGAIDLPIPKVYSASLHGYYKNFLLGLDSSESVIDDGVSDLNRARLMLDVRITRDLEFVAHYEHVAQIHPIPGSDFFVAPTVRPGLVDLSWNIKSNDDVLWLHEIDRLYVRSRHEWGDVTIGRQAIGWGVGILWTPLDLLVSFSPVQIDREYRTGVDAARAVFSLGPFTEIEAVYAFFDTEFDQQSSALRWRTTLADSNFDVGLVAGKFFDDVVLGALTTGEISGVGVHASLNFTHHYGSDDPGPDDFTRIVVGADYRFSEDVTVFGEYYFNGWGASDPNSYISRATSDRVARGEIYNVGKHYLGFLADWEAHPLVHLGARGQWNLLDPSAQLGPSLTISLSDEAQLDAGAYFSIGDGIDGLEPDSEFGPQPHFFFAAAKIYF
jgi:hypothetical protein